MNACPSKIPNVMVFGGGLFERQLVLDSVCSVTSVVSDSATLWTVARQAPLSMGFFQQEY